MKGEDVDKIFRDALGGQKAPTTERDWAAFEGMLDAKKGGWSKWTALLAFVILIIGSTALYYAFDQSEARYISRGQNSKTFLNKNTDSLDNGSESIVVLSEVSNQESDRHTTAERDQTEVQNDSKPSSSDGTPKKSGSTITQNQQTTTSPEVTSIDLGATIGESNDPDPASRSIYKPAPSDKKSEGPTGQGMAQAFNTIDSVHLPGNGHLPDGEETSAASPHSPVSNSALSNIPSSSFETELEELKLMSMRDTYLGMTLSPELIGEKRKIDIEHRRPLRTFMYFKLEQNNVLSTSSAIGIGIERNFPLGGKGGISVQGAMGYQRTGRLDWEQTSQTVTYGFDRYVEESNLRTDHLGMIQVPMQVAYQSGLHRVYTGVELNLVVNGSQEFRQVAEGPSDSGYLFDSGAPNPALFFQMGYGYAPTERIRLDLGFSAAGTNWGPANRRPLGGFIKLNYFMK